MLTIRSMIESELGMVLGWAEKEGWNPGKYDHISYYAMNSDSHFLLLKNNEPIGAISIVKYTNDVSFIGLFIVIPEYRSKGYGKHLWQHAMEYIANCKTAGLYAVPKQVPRYRISGFTEYHSNNRWSRTSPDKPEEVAHLIRKSSSSVFDQLCEYDNKVFGYTRKPMFQCMLTLPQTYAFVSFNKEKVSGYGVVRPCREGFRIGPLYAEDYESAKQLCRVLLAKIPAQKVIFDIPVINTFGEIFAEYFNLEHIPSADTIAMFKGEEPVEMKQNKCYGVNSLEFG